MSSLAATQADGYYVPSSYYDSGAYQKQTRNQFQASSSSSNPTKKSHNQFVQSGVVRFELPEDGFCQGCECCMTKGMRFNAEKVETNESYFSTKIWEFRMKCRQCAQQQFVIRTDPANRDFEYVSGIRKKTVGEDNFQSGVVKNLGFQLPASSASGALDQLEKVQASQRRNLSELERLQNLKAISERTYKMDAEGNAAIRASFRADRKDRKRRLTAGAALGWRRGMPLLDLGDEERAAAKETVYGDGKRKEKEKLNAVRQSSIFPSNKRSRHRSQPVDSLPQEDKPDPIQSSSTTPSKSLKRKSLKNSTVVVDIDSGKYTRDDQSKKGMIKLSLHNSQVCRYGDDWRHADRQDCRSLPVVKPEPTPAASALQLLAQYNSDSE